MIILDGGMGTELTRRGVDTTLPLWSARALKDAPVVISRIHRDYIDAGADVITANTFRTNPRTMQRAGIADRGRDLTRRAVQLARDAASRCRARSVLVAGSMAPVEDCYTPSLVPPDDDLRVEHGELARNLAEAGCDLLLVETMNTAREAVIAATAAVETGRPVWVSFTLGEHNNLPSGESLAHTLAAVLPLRPAAVLVNCVPVRRVLSILRELRAAVTRQTGPGEYPPDIGAYANVGHADDVVGWTLTHDVDPRMYAEAAVEWRGAGATIVGGCCGTTPEHVAALAKALGGTLSRSS